MESQSFFFRGSNVILVDDIFRYGWFDDICSF